MNKMVVLLGAIGAIALGAAAYAHDPPAAKPGKAKELHAYIPMQSAEPAVTNDSRAGAMIAMNVKEIGGLPPKSLLLGMINDDNPDVNDLKVFGAVETGVGPATMKPIRGDKVADAEWVGMTKAGPKLGHNHPS